MRVELEATWTMPIFFLFSKDMELALFFLTMMLMHPNTLQSLWGYTHYHTSTLAVALGQEYLDDVTRRKASLQRSMY